MKIELEKQASGPLKGIKVLDLSLLLPGPLCSMHLGDMGADVIKIENPRAADASRVMYKSELGVPGLFMMLNRNKKAITLNFKRPQAKEILFKLLEDADILLEGFRPDGMDKMGIGYDVLKEKFPKLIYCGISGYGISGKYVDYAGHDSNYLALAGLLHQSGSNPVLGGYQLADVGGGTLTALSAILAALYSREKTGKGQRIDISMMDGSLQFLSLYAGIFSAEKKVPEPGNAVLSGKLPNYNIYKTQDNRHVALGALEDMFFKTFLRQAGLNHILDALPISEENLKSIESKLTEFFGSKTLDDLNPIFQNEDSCLTPIRNLEEVVADPHLRDRGMILEVEHPRYGRILQFGSPFHLLGTPTNYRLHPPEHGEHNNDIYSKLGYSNDELENLKKERVI
ncbi:CaiB/BaiF CoA transferase family protein [Leptospira sp. GIMC2001]|uniref:CaiB/BaiF CoA transferase family protein n=1 Tax=Leptospira sp. GIMC2001 TaxID=1513297 RepID=UPI0004A5C580|nr:CoA transferase [Leptospira sp. GIMC2001]AID56160.1 alpha-methylacyl-CoA racemase [Leptospira sp. GIMC2001]WCL49149.1 CoA transferase [Leptospira sp. GIMC2001]